MAKIRFALAIHNHQPIGNFDGVFHDACVDSYEPFLNILEQYPEISFSLHMSGCLLEWLVQHKPGYIEQLKRMVARGQVEILGGGFYEPILPMIPARDRQGQIRGYSEYLRDLFQTPIRGMWVPERVWEQGLVSDIAQSGIEYSILDDFHFRKAGLRPDELFGYFLSEDNGQLLRIFPGSEPMRYLIPFQEVDKIIAYLRDVQTRSCDALVVFADDGEKFGTWPETKKHVYEYGWLQRFLDALRANLEWIDVVTLSQAMDAVEPIGRVYLPDCSYREMTEWALPAPQLVDYDRLWHDLDHQPDGPRIKEYLKGGYWRNFKVKYPETNEMYSRMMGVSNHLERLCKANPGSLGDERLMAARLALYRGQCNCSYWHGAFGGLYLPHLRNAVFKQLIEAENLLNRFERGEIKPFVHAMTGDLNFDGLGEVRLENDRLAAFFEPAKGGILSELDIREFGINLGASISRRPEAYHQKIIDAKNSQHNQFGSIHDRIVFKQPGLEEKLIYDWYPRKSMVDHFFPTDATLESVQRGLTPELGTFVAGKYRSTVSQTGELATLVMSCQGSVDHQPNVTVTKRVALSAGQSRMVLRYRLENVPVHRPLRFAVEFNFAALASHADNRYFLGEAKEKLGTLGSLQDIPRTRQIHLVDEWIGIDVGLTCSRPAGIWSFPIESVSQSEGGFELVHQSVCVLPYWEVVSDTGPGAGPGKSFWEVEIALDFGHFQTMLRVPPLDETGSSVYAEDDYFTTNKP
ncbi:MAG: alpha-amylase/4-alpha-glucanotransferase domain-containing protein [Planctomycetota bacterium]